MVELNKHTVNSKKGEGVVYSIPQFRFDESDNKLKWNAFRFYTPVGNSTDEDGFKYFDVDGEEYELQRGSKNKTLIIKVDLENGLEAVECDVDADRDGITIGLEGDILIRGFIPANPDKKIIIDYMEVLG